MRLTSSVLEGISASSRFVNILLKLLFLLVNAVPCFAGEKKNAVKMRRLIAHLLVKRSIFLPSLRRVTFIGFLHASQLFKA